MVLFLKGFIIAISNIIGRIDYFIKIEKEGNLVNLYELNDLFIINRLNNDISYTKQNKIENHKKSLYELRKKVINESSEEYIDDELHLNVRQIVNNLPYREREITKLYFGFYDNKTYTLQEIANIFKISRTSITKLLISVIKQVSNQLKKEGLIEVKTKETKMRLRNR